MDRGGRTEQGGIPQKEIVHGNFRYFPVQSPTSIDVHGRIIQQPSVWIGVQDGGRLIGYIMPLYGGIGGTSREYGTTDVTYRNVDGTKLGELRMRDESITQLMTLLS